MAKISFDGILAWYMWLLSFRGPLGGPQRRRGRFVVGCPVGVSAQLFRDLQVILGQIRSAGPGVALAPVNESEHPRGCSTGKGH
jgi:hypothetical protein